MQCAVWRCSVMQCTVCCGVRCSVCSAASSAALQCVAVCASVCVALQCAVCIVALRCGATMRCIVQCSVAVSVAMKWALCSVHFQAVEITCFQHGVNLMSTCTALPRQPSPPPPPQQPPPVCNVQCAMCNVQCVCNACVQCAVFFFGMGLH